MQFISNTSSTNSVLSNNNRSLSSFVSNSSTGSKTRKILNIRKRFENAVRSLGNINKFNTQKIREVFKQNANSLQNARNVVSTLEEKAYHVKDIKSAGMYFAALQALYDNAKLVEKRPDKADRILVKARLFRSHLKQEHPQFKIDEFAEGFAPELIVRLKAQNAERAGRSSSPAQRRASTRRRRANRRSTRRAGRR